MRAAGRDLPEGAVVGGTYVLGARLGSGGHGSVFAARDTRTGGEVALKLLDVEDADATQRLLREARLAMRLTHPSVVRVLDVGVGPDGVPYVAYERLVGAPLDKWIAGQPLGEERALDVIRPLLGALAEAHRAGIVHRDVKPENVFLCTPDQTGKPLVKLLDFGVAKAVFSRSIQTASGLVLGTPLYMAPEQMTGEAVGPWTDLYAVGLVLAELLGGQPVFEPSLTALIAQKTSEAPVALAPRVRSSALAPVVERAIRRWPAQRWASAEEMLAALDERSRPAAPKRQPKTVPMQAQPAPTPDPFAATLGRAEIEEAMAKHREAKPQGVLNATMDEREVNPGLQATVGEAPPGAQPLRAQGSERGGAARTIALFLLIAAVSFGAVLGGMAVMRRLRRGDATPPPEPPSAPPPAGASTHVAIACPRADAAQFARLKQKLPPWGRESRSNVRARDHLNELPDVPASVWIRPLRTEGDRVDEAVRSGHLVLVGEKQAVIVDAPADRREAFRAAVCE